MLKVTVITVVYNNRSTIADAIESVLAQTYPAIEHIVVDGLSTDGTAEIVKGYGARIAKFLSEKDAGLYHALNKGIEMATGDVIGFLHADDVFYDRNVVSTIAETFVRQETDSLYGDLIYVDGSHGSRQIRNWRSGPFRRNSFLYGWMPPHPTFYVKRTVYERLGAYNTAFKSAADYELMLRYLYKHAISTVYVPKYLVRMRIGGKSNATIRNRVRANQEDYKAWLVNGLSPRLYTRILKPLRKLFQYL